MFSCRIEKVLSRFSVGLLSLVFALITGCASSELQRRGDQSQTNSNLFKDYSDALNLAQKSSSNDEFNELFLSEATITLSGRDIKNLNRFRVGKEGNIFVSDYDLKNVIKLDSMGNMREKIGSNGNQPGSYLFPTDVIEFGDSSVAVADFQGHRVNIFSKDGSFNTSFIYTPQKFSAQHLVFNEANDAYYLFGNRWITNEAGENTGSDLIHKYSSQGEYLKSQLQFPEQFKALDLYNYSFPFSDTFDGNLYVVLPFDYTIYRINAKDELSVFIKDPKDDFKYPKTKLDTSAVDPANAYKFVQSWRLGWTPIVSLAVSGDNLLLQYQTFSPLRYKLDVWSVSSKKLKKTISTNYLLVNRGRDNNLYFLKNIEAKEQENYEIIRANFK